ncbi:S-layer homology domain-containing protein [Paenibacillus sanfengchensis]|uniref:S-layer homology domain-containing protein n=1 Tax=Paenibacillus sanfengchensis TaxID=3119819 RepID=UPI002FE10BA0
MSIGIKQKAALILLIVLLAIPASPLSIPGRAFAASEFPEDLKGHWAGEALSRWVEQGMISGYADGKIRPDQPVTRAEWMAMVNARFGFSVKERSASFSDVQPAAWYSAHTATAVRQGYITGYADGTLRPNAPVTRAEAAAMLGRLGKLGPAAGTASFKDALPAWSKEAVGSVVDAGWMTGYPDGTFHGVGKLTRAEAVVTLDRAFEAINAGGSESLSGSGEFDRPGVYGPAKETAEIAGDAFIKAGGITLQNTVIKGNLTLTEAIGSGEIHLAGVTVEGELRVNGGGPNGVDLRDTVAKRLTVDRQDDQVRIVASGRTTLETVVLSSGALLEENGLTGEGQGFVLIDVAKQVPKLSVARLRGEAETVRIAASGMRFELLSGQIERLEVERGAIGNVVYLEQGTKVIVAALGSAVTFEGPGQVLQKQWNNETQGSGVRSRSGGGSAAPTTPTNPSHPEPSVTELVYSPEALKFNDVRVDAHVTLKALLSDGTEIDATKAADWFTEDETVATVTNGIVTSQGEGETRIGAVYGGRTIRIPVKVEAALTPTVTELVYSPGELGFDGVGKKAGVILKALLSDGREIDVTEAAVWFTEDEAVATAVSGTVTSQGEGETWIGAEYGGLTMRIPVRVTVVPAAIPAYRVTLSGVPSGAVAGSDINVTVRVENSDGNLDTSFTGTKRMTLTGARQAPDSSYGSLAGIPLLTASGEAEVPFVAGQAVVAFTLNKAEAQSLTLAVDGVAHPTADLAIALVPAAPAKLQIATEPSNSVVSGETFAIQPVIHVLDAYRNLANESLTVTASVGKGAAALKGTSSVHTVNGVAAFAGLGLIGEADDVELKFSAGSLPPVPVSPIRVLPFSSGDGSAAAPYVINSAAQLNNVRNHLNGHFVLGGDIDLSGYGSGQGWVPIGTDKAGFTGTIDGQGYTIRHLTSLRPGGGLIGLFGYIDGANIKNLHLSDVTISGSMYVGGLAGFMKSGSVSGVHADNVSIAGAANNLLYAGGLLGTMEAGTLNGSSATDVNLSATYYLGGLVGATGAASSITESYSSGEVFVNGANLGGLVGTHYGRITDSYTLANITGASTAAGGLLGINRGAVIHSFAAGNINSRGLELGGLIGLDDGGTVTGSYYDSDATGQTDTGKGTPKTAAEMRQQSTFAGWDFTSIWAIQTDGYPYLRWQRP